MILLEKVVHGELTWLRSLLQLKVANLVVTDFVTVLWKRTAEYHSSHPKCHNHECSDESEYVD